MLRQDSYSRLRDTLRWRVALALGALVIVLMIALGIFNTRNGYADTAFLAWTVLAVVSGCMVAVLALPRNLSTSVSIGVATWHSRHGSIAATLNLADQALYAAKRGGRNRVAAASTLATR